MHDIEPYHLWRDEYIAENDKDSPFFGRTYDEFKFQNKIYNYFIHPQWDSIGSNTLFAKILFVDYDTSGAIIEFIGEWNDCLYNDIMYVKRELADFLIQKGICRFIFLCDNVLNFHASDDCYYEELYEDISELGGWAVFLNLQKHVEDEMNSVHLKNYLHYGQMLNEVNWRKLKPLALFQVLENFIIKRLDVA